MLQKKRRNSNYHQETIYQNERTWQSERERAKKYEVVYKSKARYKQPNPSFMENVKPAAVFVLKSCSCPSIKFLVSCFALLIIFFPGIAETFLFVRQKQENIFREF